VDVLTHEEIMEMQIAESQQFRIKRSKLEWLFFWLKKISKKKCWGGCQASLLAEASLIHKLSVITQRSSNHYQKNPGSRMDLFDSANPLESCYQGVP
jgi:hypothetical protein